MASPPQNNNYSQVSIHPHCATSAIISQREMASEEDPRSETTQRFLSQIRGMVGITPRLEETELKLLHMNTPIEGWREWGVITYDQNVIGDMLIKENQKLKKKIEALEDKIKAATQPTIVQLQPIHYPRSAHVHLQPDNDGEDQSED